MTLAVWPQSSLAPPDPLGRYPRTGPLRSGRRRRHLPHEDVNDPTNSPPPPVISAFVHDRSATSLPPSQTVGPTVVSRRGRWFGVLWLTGREVGCVVFPAARSLCPYRRRRPVVPSKSVRHTNDLLPTLTTTTILVRGLRSVTPGQPRLADDGTGLPQQLTPPLIISSPNDENGILSFVICLPSWRSSQN